MKHITRFLFPVSLNILTFGLETFCRYSQIQNLKHPISPLLKCKNVHRLAKRVWSERFNNGLVAPECFGAHIQTLGLLNL